MASSLAEPGASEAKILSGAECSDVPSCVEILIAACADVLRSLHSGPEDGLLDIAQALSFYRYQFFYQFCLRKLS